MSKSRELADTEQLRYVNNLTYSEMVEHVPPTERTSAGANAGLGLSFVAFVSISILPILTGALHDTFLQPSAIEIVMGELTGLLRPCDGPDSGCEESAWIHSPGQLHWIAVGNFAEGAIWITGHDAES